MATVFRLFSIERYDLISIQFLPMGNADPVIMYLKAYGYASVRLPKADIHPLQILLRQGNTYDRLGNLATVLVAGATVKLPMLSENQQAANINGQQSGNLKFGVGLSLLCNIIGAMGGSKLGLDVAYQRAKFICFEFKDVLEDKVEIAVLDQFLTDADVNPNSRYVAQMLEADRIYVTTAVIKSKVFTVQSKQSQSTSVALSAPVIQQAVGVNVKVSQDSDSDSKIHFEGSIPLVFGFQAVRLFYYDGRYTTLDPEKTGGAAMKALGQIPDDNRVRLLTESPFAGLKDAD